MNDWPHDPRLSFFLAFAAVVVLLLVLVTAGVVAIAGAVRP